MREAIREFIKTDLIHDKKYPLKDDEDLFKGGLVDSFSLTELAVFIEDKFNIHFADPELTVANMRTLDHIIRNLEAKQAK